MCKSHSSLIKEAKAIFGCTRLYGDMSAHLYYIYTYIESEYVAEQWDSRSFFPQSSGSHLRRRRSTAHDEKRTYIISVFQRRISIDDISFAPCCHRILRKVFIPFELLPVNKIYYNFSAHFRLDMWNIKIILSFL